MPRSHNSLVAGWLLGCCGLVLMMIVVGGTTRLTGSGLSIVKWEPVSGVVPPLSAAQWEAELAAYRATPEGRTVNADISLADFKGIYFLEYAHRFLGRLIGLAYAVPLAVFLWKRWVPRHLVRRLVGFLALGGLQGGIGWLMVASGLVDAPHVSAYRLALHLSVGLLLYAGMLWTALELRTPADGARLLGTPLGRACALAVGGILVTALWGGFVAGLRAGHAYNTFPLMDGRWIPEGLLAASPAWRNFFENILTVQFLHRWLAISMVSGLVLLRAFARRQDAGAQILRTLDVLLLAGVLQGALGVSTLLLHVPTAIGALHQTGAVLLLTASLVSAHRAAQAQ
jgi:cytochrome c oxidase assembly protein subunit 15